MIPNIKIQLQQLDDVIRTEFLPAMKGGINYSDIERRSVSLSAVQWFLPLSAFFDVHKDFSLKSPFSVLLLLK